MRKAVVVCAICLLGIAAMSLTAYAATPVEVQIAPQATLLNKVQSGQVTVHAAISYYAVAKDSVYLEGELASGMFPDDRGELVAKFDEASIKAKLPRDCAEVELTLTGLTNAGTAFAGSDVVKLK